MTFNQEKIFPPFNFFTYDEKYNNYLFILKENL